MNKKEYMKEYVIRNKEKKKEYDKIYREKNKEQIREKRKDYLKEYVKKNSEKIKEYQKEYKKQNKKRIQGLRRLYYIKTKKEHLARAKAYNYYKDHNFVCVECGIDENIELHHPNYNEPLNIIPYCKEHHINLHNNLKNNGNKNMQIM